MSDSDSDDRDERLERVALSSGSELRIIRWEPEDKATGAPWLLVHGLASNARLWDGVGARLAAAGHRAIAVDQRGHGRSSKPDDGYDMATVADDLAFLIDALELDRPAVAGQSWGGNVVIELAHRHPDLLSLVVGVDGGTIRLADQWPEWEDCARALAPPPLLGRPLSEIEGWLASSAADWPETGRLGTLANFEIRDDDTIAPWLTLERHLSVLRGLWEHDPFDCFPHVAIPTLLIGAGDEGVTTAKDARLDEAVAMLDRGAAAWFRPAHHDVHAQQPEAVAALLLEAQNADDFFH